MHVTISSLILSVLWSECKICHGYLRNCLGFSADGQSQAVDMKTALSNIPMINRAFTCRSNMPRTLIVNNQRIAVPQKWRGATVMTQDWRLVNKTELYDIRNDKAQTKDVSEDHPKVVAELQAAYETWWADASKRTGEVEPMFVGETLGTDVVLTAHDWHAKKVPWDQSVIKQAPMLEGHWEILATTGGRYRITLRQQPTETNFSIVGTRARLALKGSRGTVKLEQPIKPGAQFIEFETDIPKGRYQLSASFDQISGQTRGAYYAYVRRIQ